MDLNYVFTKLAWMRAQQIWPNGLRYLWTDAFGLILLTSLYEKTGERHFLDEAVWLVGEVERVLGRPRGIRIGEAPDRDGQYFHYLAMWLFALAALGRYLPEYRQKGIDLARQIHGPFVQPGRGVYWKMTENLNHPYPGYGFGALDPFQGYLAYRLLDEQALAREIETMKDLIERMEPSLFITQDLGLGMMLWMSHFFPEAYWAKSQRERCLEMLDQMWVETGYFCREPGYSKVKFAFTNYGVSIGLQSVHAMPERVFKLHEFFEHYRSGDHYDHDAITHVMACSAHVPGYLMASEWRSD